jgi:trans-2,3-dihydro-3-hydroxyanthranilate isomerase
MKYPFVIVDVFTKSPFGGNQLAVFPEAEGLSPRAMQALAREFNFAESTFVFPPDNPHHTKRVRIFTPSAELPFAGHPTIGTAAVLAQRETARPGDGTSTWLLEEVVGLVEVTVNSEAGQLFSQLSLPGAPEIFADRPRAGMLAKTLSVPADAVVDSFYAKRGIGFCFAHLASKGDVDRAALDHAAWAQHFTGVPSSNIFLFSGDLVSGGRLYARMFAPALGIDEDPATGSACAILAGVLSTRLGSDSADVTLTVEQGVLLGRASVIEACAQKISDQVSSLKVGGHSTMVGEGTMSVPAGY